MSRRLGLNFHANKLRKIFSSFERLQNWQSIGSKMDVTPWMNNIELLCTGQEWRIFKLISGFNFFPNTKLRRDYTHGKKTVKAANFY